ncbi:MAG: thioredoxin domain-containing protein [Gammaproteobacteria bacterium]|nr:MAG: thioredoxin domain-containing protein [Gammaproteobacteria bacterium]
MHRFAVSLLLLFVTVTLPLVAADKSGGWRLAGESSPYLQLHAGNPVEWYPWGEAAFEKARRENKPLFISIGYFTCHWCHVMARESFSDPAIAAQLNRNFVAIKIDREQRPDLDAAYMKYVVATRGQGGWPMSVWTTPDGHPFVGGTYFPPEAGGGRPGLKQLLARISELWKDDEKGVRETADRAVAKMRRLVSSAMPLQRLTTGILETVRDELAGQYDELQGGFGPAPKFPQPARLLFLLQDDNKASVDMALSTLDRMAAGGIHDQLGGGFHRYSTDFEWRVPHFEKMLYDQALIARAYLVAARQVGAGHYADTAGRILDFTLKQMQSPQGGFYSALGADSPSGNDTTGYMQEGAYYTWTRQQLESELDTPVLRDWASARYGIEEHGNAIDDPRGELAGRNILYIANDLKALARQFDVDLITARQRTAAVDARLLTARQRRAAVPVDDKIITAWNGHLITTLAQAGHQLDQKRYIEAAARAADFLMTALYDGKTGRLYRDWRAGVRGVPGFSEDYAALAEGLLMLYRVTGNERWLQQAQRLVDTQLQLFWDDVAGGFYRSGDDSGFWIREKEVVDGAAVSANGVAVHVLLDLAGATGKNVYHDRAWQTAAWAGAQLANAPDSMPYLLIRWPQLVAYRTSVAGSLGTTD